MAHPIPVEIWGHIIGMLCDFGRGLDTSWDVQYKLLNAEFYNDREREPSIPEEDWPQLSLVCRAWKSEVDHQRFNGLTINLAKLCKHDGWKGELASRAFLPTRSLSRISHWIRLDKSELDIRH